MFHQFKTKFKFHEFRNFTPLISDIICIKAISTGCFPVITTLLAMRGIFVPATHCTSAIFYS